MRVVIMGFLCLFMHLRSLCCFDHFLSGKTELIPSHKNKNLPTQHEPRDFNKGFIFIFYWGGGGVPTYWQASFLVPSKVSYVPELYPSFILLPNPLHLKFTRGGCSFHDDKELKIRHAMNADCMGRGKQNGE
jgi:hypothetical protein